MHDADETVENTLLDGRVRLIQPRRGHRAGTDAVLLAAASPTREGDTVADLGSASGAVGLMIASRAPQCRVLFVERDEALAQLCRRNLGLNGWEGRGEVIAADLLASGREDRLKAQAGTCDLVVTNPPFLDAAAARPSPDRDRAAAHHMPQGGLDAWMARAATLLKPGGRLVLIHRAERLPDCLAGMTAFGQIGILPIYPREGASATRVLISGIKGSRAPTTIRSGLVLHEESGAFTPQTEALHRGEAALGWA